MKDDQPVYFLSFEELIKSTKETSTKLDNLFKELLPFSDVEHVGSSSVPGAVGKLDLDFQIRVEEKDFEEAIKILKSHFKEKRKEFWKEGFAIFKTTKNNIPIDLVVTTKDSIYDDCYKVRDELRSNKNLLEEYNKLKMKYQGKPYSEYSKDKSDFLGENGNIRFLQK
ncbi:MAG: GrpB family protein [Candidatus Paceibacterota bacterium]|jgi:GrpB-like predicted nucleotidyltransferase (UPF0157 family)